MVLKKMHYVLIAIFITFWIIFIGWGMIKTSLKLSKEKATTVVSKKALSEEPKVKSEEEAPSLLPTAAEERQVLVRALKVKSADFQDILPVMGTVKGKTEVELKFEINGIIKSIYFREGEKIKKGELIACLDPQDAELKVSYAKNKFNSTQAAYFSTQKKLEVHKKLFDAGAIIKSKLEEVELECESAKYQVETARSEMELAENELKKTFLYANKDGIMGPREAEEGEFITPQDKLGSLLETNEVFVEVGVVERDINKIKLGQQAKVYVDAYPNNSFEGVIDSVFPLVEGKSRTLTAKIKVPNPEGLLMPGMFSRAEILIIQLKDALIVPTTCLIYSGGITMVPVIPAKSLEKREDGSETGLLQLCQVNLGYSTSDYVEITEGLKAQDLVVLEAQGELKDNTAVKIIGVEELSF